jgi:hypothetical protein
MGGTQRFPQRAVLATQLTDKMLQQANPLDEVAHKFLRHLDRLTFRLGGAARPPAQLSSTVSRERGLGQPPEQVPERHVGHGSRVQRRAAGPPVLPPATGPPTRATPPAPVAFHSEALDPARHNLGTLNSGGPELGGRLQEQAAGAEARRVARTFV